MLAMVARHIRQRPQAKGDKKMKQKKPTAIIWAKASRDECGNPCYTLHNNDWGSKPRTVQASTAGSTSERALNCVLSHYPELQGLDYLEIVNEHEESLSVFIFKKHEE